MSVDWTLCCICQKNTTEECQCPALTRRKDAGAGYQTFQEDLEAFMAIGECPLNFNISCLDEGDGVQQTLSVHRASWHKSCRTRFNKTKLQRTLKRKSDCQNQIASKKNVKRVVDEPRVSICFFCDQVVENNDKNGRCASTFELDEKVRRFATELQDGPLLAKLATGDMMALEAKYHVKCLALFYRKHKQFSQSDDVCNSDVNSIALAELVSYVEEGRGTEVSYRLADLVKLCNDRLISLGGSGEVHPTRLKNQLVSRIPDLRAENEGRDVRFMFDKNVAAYMKTINSADESDSNGFILTKAAKIVRKELFNEKTSFQGSFSPECQVNSVPQSLLALVSMILEGTKIDEHPKNSARAQAALSISQLIVFNSVKRTYSDANNSKHCVRDVPLPLYLGMFVYSKTRKRDIVDTLFELGLSVSYDGVLRVLSDVSNGVCKMYEMEKVVCPPKLCKGFFTVAALDNIDHNPSSNTSHDSFHGTSISVFQHPNNDSYDNERLPPIIQTDDRKVSPLPSFYSDVPPSSLTKNAQLVPSILKKVSPKTCKLPCALLQENHWLAKVRDLLEKEELGEKDFISWAAYHASRHPPESRPVTINALLPLFYESAHSVAMVKHGMNVVAQATKHLNPDQIPVLAMDQPLYAIGKQIQWCCPNTHGESQYVIMFGGLHIEMALCRALGTWLNGSGWTNALVQSEIFTSGTADALLKASHVKKTRHSHQVTAAALSALQHQAYDEYMDTLSIDDPPMPFEDWCKQSCDEKPLFQYWCLTLKLELLLLTFIKAQRTGDFDLYIEVLDAIIPWFFALDHTNYARWLSVHIRDLVSLSKRLPSIAMEFRAGRFVISKTKRAMSAIAIDQAHEQNNGDIKGLGGCVGLTENPAALRRWMVGGPEMARILQEFEESFKCPPSPAHLHHEHIPAVQTQFAEEVRSLVDTLKEMGNPFLDTTVDLLVIDSKAIVDTKIVETVRKIEQIGKDSYRKFLQERILSPQKNITDVIHRNNLPLFSYRPTEKGKFQVSSWKKHTSTMSSMYISGLVRGGNPEEFFQYENSSFPLSLSDNGNLSPPADKADLVGCIERATLENEIEVAPTVDTKIFDGPAVVHLLQPKGCKTFDEYVSIVFLPYLKIQLQNMKRGDIIWDVYNPDSLKQFTRSKRGQGKRQRVLGNARIPRNWNDFLRVDKNKEELFSFLTQAILESPIPGTDVYVTDGSEVACTAQDDLSALMPCTHEEADSRILLHAMDASMKTSYKILIRTVDTDVITLAVANFEKLDLDELWVAFGRGKQFKYLPVHKISSTLGPEKSISLPLFHAFTGCDTVSSFKGRGKKTAWKIWNLFGEVTQAFVHLSKDPCNITPVCKDLLERFVVLLYDKSSDITHVNEARFHLVSQGKALDCIPPTQAALHQHILRAVYQGSVIWGNVLQANVSYPDPANWGWKKGETWEPHWSTLPEARKGCTEFIKCTCKQKCTRCKCVKSSLKCTPLCSCACSIKPHV